jgi:hypothetical protein
VQGGGGGGLQLLVQGCGGGCGGQGGLGGDGLQLLVQGKGSFILGASTVKRISRVLPKVLPRLSLKLPSITMA